MLLSLGDCLSSYGDVTLRQTAPQPCGVVMMNDPSAEQEKTLARSACA